MRQVHVQQLEKCHQAFEDAQRQRVHAFLDTLSIGHALIAPEDLWMLAETSPEAALSREEMEARGEFLEFPVHCSSLELHPQSSGEGFRLRGLVQVAPWHEIETLFLLKQRREVALCAHTMAFSPGLCFSNGDDLCLNSGKDLGLSNGDDLCLNSGKDLVSSVAGQKRRRETHPVEDADANAETLVVTQKCSTLETKDLAFNELQVMRRAYNAFAAANTHGWRFDVAVTSASQHLAAVTLNVAPLDADTKSAAVAKAEKDAANKTSQKACATMDVQVQGFSDSESVGVQKCLVHAKGFVHAYVYLRAST